MFWRFCQFALMLSIPFPEGMDSAQNLQDGLKLLEDPLHEGYDLIAIAGPTPYSELTSNPGKGNVAWVPSILNIPSVFSFSNRKFLLVIPKNSSEFIHCLEQIGSILEQDKETWRKWTPTFLIHWPGMELEADNPSSKRSSSPTETDLIESVNAARIRFGLNSDVFIFYSKPEQSSELEVYELYEIGQERILQKIIMERASNFSYFSYLRKAPRRKNLHGALIRTVAYHDNADMTVKWIRRSDGVVVLENGIGKAYIEALAFSLNFRYDVIPGNGWIRKVNGTWVGMGNQMRNSEADISITINVHYRSRLEIVDFLHSTQKLAMHGFFRQPKTRTIRDIITSPFHTKVWISIHVVWIVFVSSIGILYKSQRMFLSSPPSHEEILSTSFFWIISTISKQGWNTHPSFRSQKSIFFCGSVFGLLILTAFNAALHTVLRIQIIPIKTAKELALSQMEIYGYAESPVATLQLEAIQAHRQSSTKQDMKNHLVEIDEGISLLLENNSAFVTLSEGLHTELWRQNYTPQQYCKTVYSVVVEQAGASGFAVRKGSEYKEILNYKILTMIGSGITKRNVKQYEREWQPNCCEERRRLKFRVLEIEDVLTAYFILGIGLVFSILQVLIECLIQRFYN